MAAERSGGVKDLVTSRWKRTVAWAGAAVVLVMVFVAYRDPHLMVDLANRLWSCL
jgi:hypothetical protein